jgi:N-methylhydantoinase A
VNALLASMRDEAMAVVAQGGVTARLSETRIAYMRYVGQGHEIPVPLPVRTLTTDDITTIRAAYDTEYTRFYDRPVPGSDVEIMSYAVVVASAVDDVAASPVLGAAEAFAPEIAPPRHQAVRDTLTGEVAEWAIFDRSALRPGARIAGPAIVAEDETSTLIGPGWNATVNGLGYIELTREIA